MEQTGYVTEAFGSIAKVRVDRESACGGNCVSCKGCPAEAIIVEVRNSLNLKKGDVVTLYEDSKKVIAYAAVGYGLLALLMIIGAVVGYVYTKRDYMALFSAAGFLAAGFLVIKLLFKNVKSEFKVIDVVSSGIKPEGEDNA